MGYNFDVIYGQPGNREVGDMLRAELRQTGRVRLSRARLSAALVIYDVRHGLHAISWGVMVIAAPFTSVTW